MAETIYDVGIDETFDETAFAKAIDDFAEWYQKVPHNDGYEADTPNLVIKTVCQPDLKLVRRIIFQAVDDRRQFERIWFRYANGFA